MRDPNEREAQQVEPLIDVEAAATILGMSEDWIYQEAAAGNLPSYKLGGKRKFRATELEEFIVGHRSGTLASVHDLGTRRR